MVLSCKGVEDMTTKQMTSIALMTAIICILAPLSIPIGAVPISFTNLVLYFSVYIIGTKNSLISYTLYCLLGIIGLPVFSGFEGGLGKVVGPTGGCLIGFFFVIIISGVFIERFKNYRIMHLIGMIIGAIVVYLSATLWFCYVMDTNFIAGLMVCAVPFIIGDLLKIIAALTVARKIRERLDKAGL